MVQYDFKRCEKKYFLTLEQYKHFIKLVMPHVREDDYGRTEVCNIYYDTDDFLLIRRSIEKPVYKEKLRVRSYGVPGENDNVFIELKKKFKGVVYKRRILVRANDVQKTIEKKNLQLNLQTEREIERFKNFYGTIKPKAFIAYDREAYFGIEQPNLRITFDFNMRYRLEALDIRYGSGGEKLIEGNSVLMEIKIPGACPIWLVKILSQLKIYPVSFSKYGTCYKNFILNNSKQENKKEEALCSA